MEHAKPKFRLQKKVNITILLCLIFGSFNLSFSQKDYFPGYIITLAGDTIKAQVVDQGEIQNARSLVYKLNDNKSEQRYSPSEIKAYYISNGNYFESRIFNYYAEIPVNELPSVSRAASGSAYKIETDTAFLRVVVYGRSKLFLLNDYNGNILYFVETPSGGLNHLTNNKTYHPKGYRDIRFKTKNTVGDTLLAITSDCSKPLTYQSRNRIYLTDLINFVVDYNACIGSESKIIQPKRQSKVKFGLSAGWIRSDVLFKESVSYYDWMKYDYAPKDSYTIGLLVDWYLNNPKEKWAVQTELSYNQKGANPNDYEVHIHTQHYSGMPADTIIDSVRYQIDTKYIDLSFSAKFFFNNPTKTFRPYISLGIVAGVLLNQDSAEEEIHFAGKERFYTEYDYNEMEGGFEGKAGLLFNLKKNFSLYTEFRGTYTGSISRVDFYNIQSILYGLSLGIYL
jgi:hypothetical protein